MSRSHLRKVVTLFSSILTLYLFTSATKYFSPIFPLLDVDFSLHAIPHRKLQRWRTPISRPVELVPRIIHQTNSNITVPEKWRAGQQSCLKMHEGWEYKLWTDASSLDFITEKYPWFLNTFKSYIYSIQRADAIRYFVLYHYGGIYIDLDIGCETPLTALLPYPALLRSTSSIGISNDVMTARPNHPFYLTVMSSLEEYNTFHLSPYVHVLATTGRVFLSVVWEKYEATLRRARDESRRMGGENEADYDVGDHKEEVGVDEVLVMEKEEHERFFRRLESSLWYGNDAKTFLWVLNHWSSITFMIVSAGTLSAMFLCYQRYRTAIHRFYLQAKEEEMEGEDNDDL